MERLITRSTNLEVFQLQLESTLPLNTASVPQPNAAKYLGVLLDRRLTFAKHVTDIRTRLRAKVAKHYWLLGSRSKLSLSNKLTIYKQI